MKFNKKLKHPLPKDLQKAIDAFPKIVAQKKAKAAARKKFIEKTFGSLVRSIDKQNKKLERSK